jgi:hypothetical protein
VAGEQMDTEAPRRWLLISREMAVPAEEGGSGRWAIDHLFLDQHGAPTLIEVKRATDSRSRREVVGQMLDYAANAVVYWPVEDIRARYEAALPEPKQLPPEFLGEEADPDEFWQRVKTNLQAGRVRLIFVADRIPLELRRIVEFLNVQMDPAEVLALEIEQFVGRGLKTLVPRIVGQTAEAQRRKGMGAGRATRWDETTFFEALQTHAGEAVTVARKIKGWAVRQGARIDYGRGRRYGSMIPAFSHPRREFYLFALWTNGGIELYFYWLQRRPPFDEESKRVELRQRLKEIPGIALGPDAINKRPGVQMDLLMAPEHIRRFCSTFDWVLDEIRSLPSTAGSSQAGEAIL